jgi:hypothetical protein
MDVVLFVYTVAIDFARIDDAGRIAQRHVAFSACPISEEQQIAQQKMAISPGALSLLNKFQKSIPVSDDPSVLSTMASSQMPPGDTASGASMTQQLGQLAGQPSSGGQQANSGGGASPMISGTDWRSDRPPATRPLFPPDDPLGRPAAKRTPAEAMAFAQDVENRWAQSKSDARVRPSSEEIKEACRAMLAIDPKSEHFPKAWATFVRLRKIDRDAERL